MDDVIVYTWGADAQWHAHMHTDARFAAVFESILETAFGVKLYSNTLESSMTSIIQKRDLSPPYSPPSLVVPWY